MQPRLGVTPGERRFPQVCTADITLWADLEAAASTDELTETSDYTRILARTLEIAHSREYNLLETLAYRIAKGILEGFPADRVNVKVRKHPALLMETVDHVEVEVEQP